VSSPPVAVILAAGKGTRMKSARPKALHDLCGQPMFGHVLNAVRAAGAGDVLAVVSPQLREPVEALGVRTVVQDPQDGTGHAVRLAMEAVKGDAAPILIIGADMPLLPAALLRSVIEARSENDAAVALVTAYVPLPTNFGRVVREGGEVARIVELVDATPEIAAIDEVNAGVYCFASAPLRRYLKSLRADNAQGELYLTDCIRAAVAAGDKVVTVECENPRDVTGVNTHVELAAARAVMQRRILDEHMLAGVTIVDPASTYIDVGIAIQPDTTILPQTHLRGESRIGRGAVLGPGTTVVNAEIGDGAEIVNSVVRDCKVGAGVTVGPFAHLRGGSTLEDGAHIGNFVELKNTRMGRGSKAGHLTYLGDAELGEGVNVGAGTITCNYDGQRKHKTKIGSGAFIGSNSSLVAPLEIGEGAVTGAGAVVNRDVPAGERVAGNPAKPLPKKEPSEPA
jgi:bifunctional UDP-N-acetylglucosamine pyrophosphorylase / glucosamine-1-phosphate N-acetyltransferase